MSDTIATLPVVVENDGTPLTELIDRRRAELRATLVTHGGLLFRGFDVGGVDGFDAVVRAFSGEPLTYTERSSPRHADQGQGLHLDRLPAGRGDLPAQRELLPGALAADALLLLPTAPPTLGATPLADMRRVYAEIDPAVREEFVRRRWLLVRNFHADFGTRWQDVFGTDDRAQVQAYATANRIDLEWVGKDGLRTRAVRDVVHHRPGIGRPALVQPRHLLPPQHPADGLPEGLLAMFGEEGLPANTYYGDGGEIPADVMDHLRAAYRAASVRFDYRRDDVLVVDNMTAAHGREPFTGPRKIAVAMAEPHTPDTAGAN